MSEEKPKRRKGIAGILWKQVEPLNSDEKFKEQFGDVIVSVLLNPKYQKRAALLKIDKGTIDVEDYANDKKTLKSVKRDALFEAKLEVFLTLLQDGLSVGSLLKKWITRKIKLRGIRKLLILAKLLAF